MKLKYKHQGFQAEAAQAVVKAFQGQAYHDGLVYLKERGKSQGGKEIFEDEAVPSFGNAPLQIERSHIAAHVRAIQIEQGLKPIDTLEGEGINLTIEMETGTGKTYTYIKTMYELNKHYGWSKFIVVVPSVAIREGVSQSFETMAEHFAGEYDGKRISCFVYNSRQLREIDTFASDNRLHVMVINMQAFNTSFNEDKNQDGRRGDVSARIIFDRRDDFGSRRPIDVLARTNPIIIIDEPQSVLGKTASNATRVGLQHFNPLFILRYSATHHEVLNMVYRLDAIDAYNKKLVKKIEVKGIHQIGSTATHRYIYLNEIVICKGKPPKARLNFETISKSGQIRQITKLLGEGADLYTESGEMAEYNQGYIIHAIDGKSGTVTFLNNLVLHEGDAVGEVSEDLMRRIQIQETIKSHIERECKLYPKGIKVLSLFFIDHVENYRVYNSGGTSYGKFAQMFEEEYTRLVEEMRPELTDEAYIRYLQTPVNRIHNGYFSQDKKTGNFVNPKTKKEEKEGSNDAGAYELIMKDKERLLSIDEPTRFIFSHSALREGWDNPNVFQICTLKNTGSEIGKRQEVGRGMRLCVNQYGERQDPDVLGSAVFDINVLTVIASESYEQFSRQLQLEISEMISSRPVLISPNLFVDYVYETAEGKKVKITEDDARRIYNQLIRQDYIDDEGKLTHTYHKAKANDTLDFGEQFKPILLGIMQTLDSVFEPKKLNIDNSRKAKVAKFDKDKFYKSQFQELWKHISVKTYYKVDFETAELINKSIEALDKRLRVTEVHLRSKKVLSKRYAIKKHFSRGWR